MRECGERRRRRGGGGALPVHRTFCVLSHKTLDARHRTEITSMDEIGQMDEIHRRTRFGLCTIVFGERR